MLQLNRLEIEGFGPFADRQVIDFPKSAGVTVIYGENMRGKTSLLNAIRYAFFGNVKGRGSRERPLHTLTNRDLAAQKKFGFEVALLFDFDGVEYELVRAFTPKHDQPMNDGDYLEEFMLRRGTTTLGPGERERVIQQILPSDISRFFLFDGELLQEYEELLHNESEAGTKISAAIERILGVPIIQRGRQHLSFLADEAEKISAREALKHKETESLGNALQTATLQKDAHLKEVARLEARQAELLSQRGEAEQRMKENERYARILDERDAAVARQKEAVKEEQQAFLELQRAMESSWRALLREPIKAARSQVQEKLAEAIEDLVQTLRSEAARDGSCRVCLQSIDDEQKQLLTVQSDTQVAPRQAISTSFASLEGLNAFDDLDNSGEVRTLWEEIQRLRFELAEIEDKLKDLKTALDDANPELVRLSQATYHEISEGIASTKRGIEDEQAKIIDLDKNIQKLTGLIQKAAPDDISEIQARATLLRNAAEIFRGAVDRYKSDLRARVEVTASQLFKSMTTEKEDYSGLMINEAYGLTIQHRDGRAEDSRSAGAEHIVALALMGALQHNAPLRGPIVMDSPFGRLDELHTANVVKTLPKMAEQTILLVYEAEVGREMMRSLLGAHLVREYQLDRRSARRTDISRVR